MLLNNKYFLSILTTIGMQFVLGINSSYAVPCEDKVDTEFNYNGDYGAPVGKVWEYLWGNTHAKYTSVEDAKNKLYDTAVRYIDNRYEGNREECVKGTQYETNGGIELIACMNQVLANNGCDPSVFKKNGASPQRNSSSNKSSSSGASKQAKSNPQPTNSQSNQSNAGQFSKMSTDQLINLSTAAEERRDYAQAYAAELELTKNPDPEISRQALRRVGFRLGSGQGVNKNLTESHRISLQAASLGDITAYQHVCTNYMEGYGVQENHQKAIEYCLVAAEKGDAVAQANLGWLYESGSGIQHSSKLSDEWTCKAAAQGQPTAVNNVKKAQISAISRSSLKNT